MFNALRRLLTKAPKPAEPEALMQWAQRHGHTYLNARNAAGCVVEGRLGTQAWRLEWGAPQRDYIAGLEMRMLADLTLPKELVALVLNQELGEVMEKRVYDDFVDDVQTRIETQTPPEMRWLVMYPKLTASELGPLRDRFVAVSGTKLWLQQWLASPLGAALDAAQKLTGADEAVVLSLHRCRLCLRLAMPDADMVVITAWFSVFEAALRESMRLGAEWQGSHESLTTRPETWQPGVE